jgi:hypothetical protein
MKLINFFIILPFLYLVILVALYLGGRLETVIFNSFLYGFIISTINILLGLALIRIGISKSDKFFFITVFGGSILRLFIVFLLIILTLIFLFVSLNSFIFITFIFYFYYLIIEVYILSRKKLN